jgi:putative transposase
LPERQLIVAWLGSAVAAGARKIRACQEIGLSLRTLQRWTETEVIQADARTIVTRPTPRNALSEVERQTIVTLCNSPEYAHLPPSQIVPRLADQGRYVASEATFYRVLRAAGQQQHRGRSQRQKARSTDNACGQSAQSGVVVGHHVSALADTRKVLLPLSDRGYLQPQGRGLEVYDAESGEKAAALLQRSVIGEQCLHEPLVLHSDNGAPMKSVTLLSKMYDLGITPSRGRPRVSNDNPYSESLFRTLKYCPQWPLDGFASLDAARAWVRNFMRWYNNEHRHSRIRFVTPAERHRGLDHQVLARRHELYERAKENKPERWSGRTRNWEPIGTVLLNPDREQQNEKMAA